jgi:AraC family transcriptional regulator
MTSRSTFWPTCKAASIRFSFISPVPPLQQFSSDNGLGTVGNLEMELGRAIPDLIVEHLGHCLLPAIEHPKQTNGLFVDYIALALYAVHG